MPLYPTSAVRLALSARLTYMAPAQVVKGRERSKTLRAAAPRAEGMAWAVRVRARAVAKGACLAKAPLGFEQAGFRRGRQVGHPSEGRKAAGGREAQAAQAVDQAGAVQGGGEGVDLGLGTQGDAEFTEGGGRAGDVWHGDGHERDSWRMRRRARGNSPRRRRRRGAISAASRAGRSAAGSTARRGAVWSMRRSMARLRLAPRARASRLTAARRWRRPRFKAICSLMAWFS